MKNKKKFHWEEVEGIKNLNVELMKRRHWSKKLIEKIFGLKPTDYYKYRCSLKGLKKQAKLQKRPYTQLQKCDSLAIIFIGTNKYIKFFPKFYKTIKKYFLPKTPKHFFVFTNKIDYEFLKSKKDVKVIEMKHENTSFASLFRFKNIISMANQLKKYSHILYLDSDMYANNIITTEKEFFCHDKPLFSMKHPSFLSVRPQLEKNPLSTAAIKEVDSSFIYRQCCFWGGKSKELLNMCKELDKNIIKDLKNKIIAMWLDESHLNKYFSEHPEIAYVHDSSYGYPGSWPIPKGYKARIIHKKY